MIAPEYEKILSALATISRVLDANEGQLNPADIRIRCLVNITVKEAKRALLEVEPTESAEAAEQPDQKRAPVTEAMESSP